MNATKTLASIALGVALFGSTLSAASIDTANAKASFTAFKTAKKAAVNGTFNNIAFKFGKGDDIAAQLEGATATMEAMAINLGDDVKDKNLKDNFFSFFKKDKKGAQPIKVTFRNVRAGENVGTILANVSMNGKNQKVPMLYTIENNTITAKGVIDVLDFGLGDAFDKLAAACKDLHEGTSWTQVEISFSAPLK
ncbi:hypothetical protein BKN38_06920 [Helicobacter sp. CLO-3]|uniref:YceI family protein n=1 Tax=unclassified Helicobacter TaxID=2593540 RepID=UPI000805BB7E|nr:MULTISPECIES: YceI family protein [unclassified Helicobacter]OBV28619.1 hypothetical protein BA723_01745 [Helicobacter sp. CLO-3]OHU82500.1 hypothetical protein BKN38_06920 [Helicobacter sp. CLO-3]